MYPRSGPERSVKEAAVVLRGGLAEWGSGSRLWVGPEEGQT